MNHRSYLLLYVFAAILFVAAFFFNSPDEIIRGFLIILQSPANLFTDYFNIANVGATFMNSFLMVLISILILKSSRAFLNGSYIAAVFTVAGFSLFGKNPYNSLPLILGVFLYSKIRGKRFEEYITHALYGTALSPLVSEFTFNLGFPMPLGILMGVLSGLVVGLVITPLAEHFKRFHKGFNLYNVGFTAGIIGTFFIAILRNNGLEVDMVNLVAQVSKPSILLLLGAIIGFLLLWGLSLNQWSMRGYWSLLKCRDVENRDYVKSYSLVVTLINMSFVGIIGVLYVLLVGGEFSGPVIGGIFTMMGFGAYGKHPLNILPIILGVFIVACFNKHDLSSVSILLAALFGTTLAPISQKYGPIAGVVAGGIHVSLVINICYLHAGMNLYNNGFSGGLVAAVLVPVLDIFLYRKSQIKTES